MAYTTEFHCRICRIKLNMEQKHEQSVNRAIKRISSAYNATEEVEAKKEHREPVLLPDFSAHSLRHTFCTRLCERETNLKVIQSIMGHKDIQTTMDIYAEATEEKKQETFEHLAATMDSLTFRILQKCFKYLLNKLLYQHKI